MKHRLASVAVAAALFCNTTPAGHGQTARDETEPFERALDATLKDPKTPRLAQVLQEAKSEEEEEEEAANAPLPTPTPRKQTVKADPPTLPEWTPPVPQFKPDGPVAKTKVDGVEKIAQTGTSTLTPAQLGDSWETEKTATFMRARNNLTVNGQIIVKVTLTDYYQPKEEVHLEAVRGPNDKVTHVTIYSPMPKAAGSNRK